MSQRFSVSPTAHRNPFRALWWLGLAALAIPAQASPLFTIYSIDFENGLTPNFLAQNIVASLTSPSDLTPTNYIAGTTNYLRFNNSSLTLSLSNLQPSAPVIFTFQLYIIDTWDGDCGPDAFGLTFAASTPSATFSNNGCTQNFGGPGSPGGTGRSGTLGTDTGFGAGLISVYDAGFTTTSSPTGTLDISFFDFGLGSLADESWGIDNVSVASVPEPSTGLMLLGGLGAALAWKRRRKA